jgi:hypothetical protein
LAFIASDAATKALAPSIDFDPRVIAQNAVFPLILVHKRELSGRSGGFSKGDKAALAVTFSRQARVPETTFAACLSSAHASLSKGDGSGAMSTIAIVILVAIGLVILMYLNLREEGSALASYIVAMGFSSLSLCLLLEDAKALSSDQLARSERRTERPAAVHSLGTIFAAGRNFGAVPRSLLTMGFVAA